MNINLTTLVIGLIIVGYGTAVLVMRLVGNNDSFRKLDAMKEKLGDKAGSTLHYLIYVVLPFVLGAIVVYLGIRGVAIFAALFA